MSTIPAPSAEALNEDAKANRKPPSNEGESAQAPAEGPDELAPPTAGSAKG
jgi:hypothetical protein